MAARTVPHAYPMSSEYEFANPSKIYDQNFGEGKEGGGIPPLCAPLLQGGWGNSLGGAGASDGGRWRGGILSVGTWIKSGGNSQGITREKTGKNTGNSQGIIKEKTGNSQGITRE